MFKFYPERCIRESVNLIKLSRLIQIFLLILITLTNSWSDDIDDLEERLKKTTNKKKQVEILNLRRELEEAVENEDYENAAKIRDRIEHLQ